MLSNTAVITAIREKDGFDVIATDSSVFFPLGGGQPSDIGTVSSGDKIYEITAASDESLESDVWHVTDAPAGTFKEGDTVTLTIDWDNRFCNMQRHLGEHMLSGTMHSLFGGVNKGFHMGEEFITIDIDLDGRMLTAEELDLAEKTVNEAIWANLPVTVTKYETYEESLVMPVRKKVPHDGDVWIVTVGDAEDPYDCIACCGTHPANSAEVGLLAIYKCEPNKGMNRIFFDCGRMAKEKLCADSHLLSNIAKRFSCSTKVLMDRFDSDAENLTALKARLSAMSAYVREAERKSIMAALDSDTDKVFTYSTDILSVDELLKLGFSVIADAPDKILAFCHPESHTCLLFSSCEFKCGQYIKEHAKDFGGKGGGRDDNARALFSTSQDMRNFASELKKMV